MTEQTRNLGPRDRLARHWTGRPRGTGTAADALAQIDADLGQHTRGEDD